MALSDLTPGTSIVCSSPTSSDVILTVEQVEEGFLYTHGGRKYSTDTGECVTPGSEGFSVREPSETDNATLVHLPWA